MNKKGFTLVELLAVIVVLAFILVLVVPTVLKSMNNAQQASFQTYAKKMVNAAMQTYEAERVIDAGVTHNCYNIARQSGQSVSDLGSNATGSYEGKIVVSTSNGETTYTVYMTDGKYVYNPEDGVNILNGTVSKVIGENGVVDLTANLKTCTTTEKRQ